MDPIRKVIILPVSLIFFISIILPYSTISMAQGEAEENLMVVGNTPMVKIGEDTDINLYFEDYGGINYTWAVNTFGYLVVNVEWPILFGYVFGGGNRSAYQELKDYLCYHTIEFSAYIDGNKSGWHAIVEPSVISGTTMGHKYNLTLKVRVDGLSYSPEATVVIKVTRKGAGGKVLGISYHRIPLKAEHIYLLEIKPLKPNVEVTPGSDVYIPVEITNRGNYVETYILETKEKGGVTSGMVGSQVLTLLPGETSRINVHVSSPFNLFDVGTPGTVTIEAYPINNPNVKFFGDVSIISRGVSLLGIPMIALILIIVGSLVYILVSIPKMRGKEPSKKEIRKIERRKEPREFSSRRETKREYVVEKRTISKKVSSTIDRELERKLARIRREQERQRRKLQKL